jgi:hypothetical protein
MYLKLLKLVQMYVISVWVYTFMQFVVDVMWKGFKFVIL